MDRELAGSGFALSFPVLFALFVISLLVTIGLAIYAGGALIGTRATKIESFSVHRSASHAAPRRRRSLVARHRRFPPV